MDINKENEFNEFTEDFQDNSDAVVTDGVVTEEDYNEDTSFYEEGEFTLPVSASKKKSCIVQKTIIISIVAFLLTAVLVFSSVFVYDMVVSEEEKFTLVGVWTVADNPDSGMYYVFDEDGVFNVNIGGQILTGSYFIEDMENTDSETGEKIDYQIMTLTPNVFSNYESQARITLDEETRTMSMTFMYIPEVKLVKTELPEFKIDGSKVTHASADEFGIDSFVGDDEIIGSWLFEDYTGDVVYTFNADGTGSLVQDYKDGGYSISMFFKYFTVDGKILVTVELNDGSSSDGEMNYYMDKGKMIINDLAFVKTNK